MNASNILINSINLIKANYIQLILRVLPVIFIVSVFGYYWEVALNNVLAEPLHLAIGFIVDIILETLIIYISITLFLNSINKEEISLFPSISTAFVLWFSSCYVGIASIIGFMLLFIPGLIIISVSVYYPIFVIKYNQGPIESVASSVDIVKQNFFFTISLLSLFLIFWIGSGMGITYIVSKYEIESSAVLIGIDISMLIIYILFYAITVSMFKASQDLEKQ